MEEFRGLKKGHILRAVKTLARDVSGAWKLAKDLARSAAAAQAKGEGENSDEEEETGAGPEVSFSGCSYSCRTLTRL